MQSRIGIFLSCTSLALPALTRRGTRPSLPGPRGRPPRPIKMHTATTTNGLGFWAGYRIWLGEHRRALIVLFALSVLLFLVGLWFGAAPQDPFQYELF